MEHESKLTTSCMVLIPHLSRWESEGILVSMSVGLTKPLKRVRFCTIQSVKDKGVACVWIELKYDTNNYWLLLCTTYCAIPDLSSINVTESMMCLGPEGAFNGIMVGTATAPAVITVCNVDLM